MKALYTFLLCCFCLGVVVGQSDIASIEYFFDADPGIGNGILIDIDPDAASIDQNFNIPTTGLSEGTHRLFMRSVNLDGTISMFEHKTFRIAPASDNNTSDIVEAEYFVDQDPGVGNANFIDVVDGSLVNEALNINTGSMSNGTHRLFVRVKNSDNTWSLYDHKTFRIAPASDNNISDIDEAEYFIDVDPGIGNATSLVLNGDVLDENLTIPTPGGISQGDHYLHIRVKNTDGTWSLYDRQLFEIDGTLSNNSFDLSEINIFPNPSSNLIHIQTPSHLSVSFVRLIDINGKIVLESQNQLHKINISNLANGMYLLQLTTEQGKLSKRIIKQ
ncbi:MAG: T9SS type A sorting domain-containing protein [Flavobacteriaceae bacterium]